MSNQPKKISVQIRETVNAHSLRTRGERVTVKEEGTTQLGFLLDGKLYRAPGISNYGSRKEITDRTKVIRDGGKKYDAYSYA